MFATLEKALGRIRQTKDDRGRSVWKDYRDKILLPLAKDQEVDAETLEQFMIALDLNEDQVRKDVTTLKKRFGSVDRMQELNKLNAELREMQEKQRKLNAERDAWWAAFQAKSTPVFERVRELENQNIDAQINQVISDMRSTILDPVTKIRIAEINARVRELGKQRSDIHQRGVTTALAEKTERLNKVSNLRAEYAKRDDYDAKKQIEKLDIEIRGIKNAVSNFQNHADIQRSRDIETEQRKLNSELGEIYDKALVP